MRFLVILLLVGTAFAELPDAPSHSRPQTTVVIKNFVRDGERAYDYSVPIPRTPARVQLNMDDFGMNPFHQPMMHAVGHHSSWSLGVTIRLAR